jgi:hypothetical protein
MQTLTVLPALSNPPLFSENDTFQKDVSAISNLNNRQLLALRILAKVYQLAANGGTDYTADFDLLISSTKNLFGNAFNVTFNTDADSPMNRWQAVLDWNDGYTADNTLPTDVEEIIADTVELVIEPEATLYQVLMFLHYKLAE